MTVETVNDVRSSVLAEIAADLEADNVAPVAPAEAAKKEIPEGETPTDDSEGPETATDTEEVETTDETDEDTEEPETVVDPPHFWSKEEKEQFASLPPEMQTLVKTKFDDNERYVNQQKMELADAKKSAAKEAESLSVIAKRIESAAQAAETQFADKWSGCTPQWWADLAKDDPTTHQQYKAQYDADQHALKQSTDAKGAAEQLERARWVQEEGEQLKTLVPELFTPEGKKVGDELKAYIISTGASEQDLSDLSAVAWQIAFKAMKYDKAQSAKPIAKKPAASALPSKSAPPPRATVKQAERSATEKKAFGSNGQRPDRAAMVDLLIKDGYA